MCSGLELHNLASSENDLKSKEETSFVKARKETANKEEFIMYRARSASRVVSRLFTAARAQPVSTARCIRPCSTISGPALPESVQAIASNGETQPTTGTATLGKIDVEQGQLMMIFTCDVCKTRTAKMMSKQAYQHGVVIAQCPSCKNRHLIADNLGWFGEGAHTIEDVLKKKGQEVKRSWDGEDFQLSPEDVSLYQQTTQESRE
eukprot:scpid95233/ scgid10597/ DNL-type zinc finger protein